MNFRPHHWLAALFGVLLWQPVRSDAALALTFQPIQNLGTLDDPISITGSVSDYGAGVEINITHASVIGSDWVTTEIPTITLICFDDAALPLLSNPSTALFAESPGVNFLYTGSANLPQGETLSSPFATSFAFDAEPPPIGTGLDPGESIVFRFLGASYSAVEAALLAGDIRIGLHVQQIGPSDASTSFIYAPPGDPGSGIPEPSSATLLLLGGACIARRMRSR